MQSNSWRLLYNQVTHCARHDCQDSEIWDTAGQEQFKKLAPMYNKNAAAEIICYNVTSPKLFETLECK